MYIESKIDQCCDADIILFDEYGMLKGIIFSHRNHRIRVPIKQHIEVHSILLTRLVKMISVVDMSS